jgi:hypothetical protein
LKKISSTVGDRSGELRNLSLVLYHCTTVTLTIIKKHINIFCHFSEVA